MPKICGLSISFQGENKEYPTLLYKPFHSLYDLNERPYESIIKNLNEILYVSLLIYITDYLIGLAFWAFPIVF